MRFPVQIAQFNECAHFFSCGGEPGCVDEFGTVNFFVVEFVLNVIGKSDELASLCDHVGDFWAVLCLQAEDSKLSVSALFDPAIQRTLLDRTNGLKYRPAENRVDDDATV